jgi:hypothetical protein
MPSHWWIILTVVSVVCWIKFASSFSILILYIFLTFSKIRHTKVGLSYAIEQYVKLTKRKKILALKSFHHPNKKQGECGNAIRFLCCTFYISHDCWQCCIFVNIRLPKIRIENITSPMPGLVILTAGLPILYYKIPDGLVQKKFCQVIFV